MPQEITTQPGDSLISLAQKFLGDGSQWREIADISGIDPLQELGLNESMNIPLLSEIQKIAQPILSSVSQGVNGNQGILNAAVQAVESQLGEHEQAVLSQLGDINGILKGDVDIKSTLKTVLSKVGDRQYDGTVKLVDWLLQN